MIPVQQTVALMKSIAQEILPEAKVLLFGSRANNTATKESDWDILIITRQVTDKKTKRLLQDALFPLSVRLASFINITLVSETEWNTNPSYYSLKQSIAAKSMVAQ